jgi:hypothetical protein
LSLVGMSLCRVDLSVAHVGVQVVVGGAVGVDPQAHATIVMVCVQLGLHVAST